MGRRQSGRWAAGDTLVRAVGVIVLALLLVASNVVTTASLLGNSVQEGSYDDD